MLKIAGNYASGRAGASDFISVTDILVAFLYEPLPQTIEEMAVLGLTADAAPVLLNLLAAQSAPFEMNEDAGTLAGQPAAPEARIAPPLHDLPNIPGFDEAASAILRLGQLLSGRRIRPVKVSNTASTLLVAMADAGSIASDLPEVAALRRVLHADDEDSIFSRYRREEYHPLTDPPSDVAAQVYWNTEAMSPGLTSVCDEAIQIAGLTSGTDALASPRHLAAALIFTRTGEINEKSDQLKNERGLAEQAWRDALSSLIPGSYPRDNGWAWARILGVPRRVATFNADTIPTDPRAADVLGSRRYSDAMAALISAKALRPPLSIAIFGAWGSGKSFFMRMIRSAVSEFAAEAAKAAEAGQQSLFLDGIVHIEFNAWHYAEENLWASLVQSILAGVQDRLSPSPIFSQVLGNLVASKAAENAAKKDLDAAVAVLAERRTELAEAEETASQLRSEHSQLVATDVLRSLRQTAIAAIVPEGDKANPKAWISGVSETVQQAADAVGRPELADSLPALSQTAGETIDTGRALAVEVGDVQNVIEQIRGSERRGAALFYWLLHQRMSAKEWVRVLAPVAAAFGVLMVVGCVLVYFGREIIAALAFVGSLILPWTLAIRPILDRVRSRIGDTNRVFARLEKLRDSIEAEKEKRLAEKNGNLIAAQKRAAEAEASVAKARLAQEEATYEVEAAREAARMASGTEQLRRFVGQRLDEGDYVRRLGLIHTIRLDFGRLQGLLEQITKETDKAGSSGAPLKRVVLYIDDLDRCPPERVVEVLEAVHLLLAYEMFVVVVGVDIRWVEQALKKRYAEQLSGVGGVASPMDYLEKVFQIPFWLPPMDAMGGAALLAAAIGRVEPPPPPLAVQFIGPDTRQRPGAPSFIPSIPPILPPVPGPGPVFPPPPTLPTAALGTALLITHAEYTLMRQLSAVVGISPRRAKRFANLYRILKATLSADESVNFVSADGHGGSYEQAMILLALTTGAPHAAAKLLTLLTNMADDEVKDQHLVLEMLQALTCDADETAAFKAGRDMMDNALGGTDWSAALTEFRLWAPRVRRFAFDASALRLGARLAALGTVQSGP